MGESREIVLRRSGPSGSIAGLTACLAPLPDLSWPPGVEDPGYWSSGGAVWGRAGKAAPPPGKQTLPHILRTPRPFPAPSQPEEGPRATPLPAPQQAEPALQQEVGAEPRPR